ncbi:MAG TPA: carboxypeptidase-like regulatory domain-containing protein, partial [Ktedonobacterales bacterium]|nr:carboxypeptidase-like regulatory domain-containing protein [Ktedonobacterales bacterium]
MSGKVIARPNCPVERADQPCKPAPVTNRAVSIETPDGTVVATVTTDAQGQFSATLDPGSYVIHVAIVHGQPGVRQLTPGDVTILAGKTTSI